MKEFFHGDPGDEHRHPGTSLDFSREQLMEAKRMQEHRAQILKVLDNIPQDQNSDENKYEDSKGKKGWSNPVRPVIGLGLEAIVRALNPKRGVELGTARGRSGLHMALGGLQILDTCEMQERMATEARNNFANAGIKFNVHNSDSSSFIASYTGEAEIAFIDHAKERTLEDLIALEPHLAEGALVLIDNSFNRASEMEEAVAYVGANYFCGIFTEPPTGEDQAVTGLLVASKDRATFDLAWSTLIDVRSQIMK